MRKIAIATLAGAAASGVVIAKRAEIYRLINTISRNRQLKKLDVWYQGYLNEIDEYATIDADRYIESNRESLVRHAKRKEYSDARTARFIERIRRDARELIAANYSSQVTKKYADYLSDVDMARCNATDEQAKRYVLQMKELTDKLHDKGCNVDSLITILHTRPPH